ncbi:MAG: excinuclease ABC subunit UvrC [Methanoregulaceae archaeon]|nr:excinuclease ABC subunit UvrC [Methanoregulaceae archaeon]
MSGESGQDVPVPGEVFTTCSPEDAGTLPISPGCYLFRNGDGEILYIGKAKNLRKRVQSYFKGRDHDQKTTALVGFIATIDYIVTTSELEALILESSLIKEHQPRFNIDLKDSKGFSYIQLTGEEFPCVRIARTRGGSGMFFGPFISAAERDYIFSVVKKTFRLRTCRKMRKRACLRRHLHSCSAPCRGEISPEDYAAEIRKATVLLRGKSGDLVATLRREMRERSDARDYERARVLRDQIHAIEGLSKRQSVSRPVETDEDVINTVVAEGTVYLMLFNVHAGTLVNKREYVYPDREDFLEEFLTTFYGTADPPGELILPEGVSEAMREYLAIRKGRKVTVTVPKIGPKKKLLDLVRMNIEVRYFGDMIRLEELREVLSLASVPHVIECFDISHISGTSVVGSMVRFRDGRPEKKEYRRFRIRTVEGIDDPRAIGEVVSRRYARLKAENTALPDLIVIDGGRTQLAAASAALRALECRIPVIALAKRNEEIYVQGNTVPIPLDRRERSSLLVQEIRDEAHRFALAYHRLLRKKQVIG